MWLILWLGCWESVGEERDARVAQMKLHAAMARQAREGVRLGDLDAARRAGVVLLEQKQPPGLHHPAQGYMDQVHRAARGLAQAVTVADAAGGVGGLALACSRCHRAAPWNAQAHAWIDVAGEFREDLDDDALHGWSIERMWDGLLWSREDWFMEGWASAVRSMGPLEPLSSDESWSGRSRRFAGLMETCAGCHGPGAEP